MKTGVHNVEAWFGSNQDFVDFYEKKFVGSTTLGMKFPASYVNKFTTNGVFDKAKAAGALAEVYINGIARIKYKQLSRLMFKWLKKETKDTLKQAACEAVQHALLNNNVFQRLNASSISMPSFTMNSDTSQWMLSTDMYGKIAWNLIMTSGLDKYEWVAEDELFLTHPNGSIEIIGKADASKIPDLA